MTAADVVREVLADRVFHEQSGGGVTFSGGEPLLQPQFLIESLEACRGEDLHTAVDTSGHGRTEDLVSVARATNLFLYDLKLMDDALHREYTGVSNRLILENLEALGRAHDCIWLRIPLVAEVTDTQANLEAIARFASRIRAIRQVNLLPYHATGQPKSNRLARSPARSVFAAPNAQRVAEAQALFARFGFETRVGG